MKLCTLESVKRRSQTHGFVALHIVKSGSAVTRLALEPVGIQVQPLDSGEVQM